MTTKFAFFCLCLPGALGSTNISYTPLEGEIYVAKLGVPVGYEMGKKRPCLVVQSDSLTKISPDTIVVAPLSTDLRKRPVETLGVPLLRIKARDRLQEESIVLVDQLRAISPTRLRGRGFLTQLTFEEMSVVREGIGAILTGKMQNPRTQDVRHQQAADQNDDYGIEGMVIFFAIFYFFPAIALL